MKFLQVLVVEGVCPRNVLVVPPVLARLVGAEQQDCRAARNKCLEGPIGRALVLDAQLPHVAMPRGRDA